MLKKALLLIVLVFISISGLFYAYSTLVLKNDSSSSVKNNDSGSIRTQNNTDSEVKSDTRISKKDRLNLPTQEGLGFISYLSDLDNFNIESLKYNDDIRGVYKYKGNDIVIAFPKIIEYNFEKEELLRISSDLIECAYSAVVLDGNLFVSCNPDFGEGGAYIKRIDLSSGKIDIEQQGIDEYEVINARFFVVNDVLYMSSWDGVFELDLDLNIEEIYSFDDVGFVKCNYSNVNFFYDEGLYGFCNTDDEIFVFDDEENLWEPVSDMDVEFGDYYNLRSEDFNISVPFYFVNSNKVDEKLYILSSQGVHLLYNDSMPEIFVEADLNEYILDNGLFPPEAYSFFVTSEEYYGILVIREIYQGPTPDLGEAKIVLFDLVDQMYKDITSELSRDEREDLLELMISEYDLGDITFTENNDFEVDINYEGNSIIRVDLSNLDYALIEE